MSVGKASIKRAANAGTKKAAEVKETTTEVKAPEAVKADNVKSSRKDSCEENNIKIFSNKDHSSKEDYRQKNYSKISCKCENFRAHAI